MDLILLERLLDRPDLRFVERVRHGFHFGGDFELVVC